MADHLVYDQSGRITGIYIPTVHTAQTITLHEHWIKKLLQKGRTIDWLTHQSAEMTFDPNSREQCVFGRLLRQTFGDHDFAVNLDHVAWEQNVVYVSTPLLRGFFTRYQWAMLEYVMHRDGCDENGDAKAGSRVTRDEAIKVAKGTNAR